jgi:hypothetical protein
MESNPEQTRLDNATPWRKWGPYLAERQWGTVREDYSADGSAWTYFPHDHARSRAYRWGEDGIGGICDNQQHLCFALGLWNGRDPILKERLFGLTGPEGNHGEDCKELYYYLDATPTASYLKMLFKYPQAEYPYRWLVEENRRRTRMDPEFELLDTGIFNDDRYFDVFIEYAKQTPEDIVIQITVCNRGPDAATLHLLPQLWFRNTWSWTPGTKRPTITSPADGVLEAFHETFGTYFLRHELAEEILFCDNDTNATRLFGVPLSPGYFKDAFHECIVHNNREAVNPARIGTKAAVHHRLTVPAGGQKTIRLRLSDAKLPSPFDGFDQIVAQRRSEADAFYAACRCTAATPDERMVQRQAFAGLIWCKQFYCYELVRWLQGDPAYPPPPAQRLQGRNSDWTHVNINDVISMPDTWEYPWFAAWDLGFHCVVFSMIDPDFAKRQLIHLTREWYMHPNGQLPAYEWAFGDVNPPVHAWAALRIYQIDKALHGNGEGDLTFLKRIFNKMLLNFTWWVNRKDVQGRNIFQGGFLGLDNIGVFDRSARLPTGGFISQCDGTSWMAMFCLTMMRIALELAMFDIAYEDLATKFFEHFLYIAAAMTNIGGQGINLWSDDDNFYYDVLCLPDNTSVPLKIRSMVGLIPLFAIEVLDPKLLAHVPAFEARLKWFLNYRPDLALLVSRWYEPGGGESRLLSLLRGHRMKCLLRRMLDETEFLSDYGVRALSRWHKDHPYIFEAHGERFVVSYQPGESESAVFGGNSNWRGPIWMPVNYLLIGSLRRFHSYYGDDFKVECPTGSGIFLTIDQIADELTRRLARLFLPDAEGKRPSLGLHPKMQDPHFRDYLQFYEYFHGDIGRGVGASHQTGWTAAIAALLSPVVAKSAADKM